MLKLYAASRLDGIMAGYMPTDPNKVAAVMAAPESADVLHHLSLLRFTRDKIKPATAIAGRAKSPG